jgi:hypothetical protein
VYCELGCTLTCWPHWAKSCPAGVPAAAPEPEWVGDETAAAAEQVQPDRPVSKPGFATRLAVAPVAGWATIASVTRAVAVRPANA